MYVKQLVLGILAHVDAGKTTLSESILHQVGEIRALGRVDHGDTYLDTDDQEKQRGITIFSKQARLHYQDMEVMLVDTPGHVDFAAEMERTLQILDYAVLVISGSEGVQSHTRTLWKLLKYHEIPTFIFVNKMDLSHSSQEELIGQLQKMLDSGCMNLATADPEDLATVSEEALEEYMETGEMSQMVLTRAVAGRTLFPVIFGSALKEEGTEELLEHLSKYTQQPEYPEDFGGKVYKIGRDESGGRLTYMKMTGGSLQVRQTVTYDDEEGEEVTEKITQIRIYSGDKFETVNETHAGQVCTILGLSKTRPGQGLGVQEDSEVPVLEPVLSYEIILPEEAQETKMMEVLRDIEEEDPQLKISWDERHHEIQVHLMGPVQLEVLQEMVKAKTGFVITFGPARVTYKETITNSVVGIGHFEPLRHYAEVQLLLEPGELGSGMQYETNCPIELLDKNWQSQIMNLLRDREHKGILTGSFITDMKVTLIAGRAHVKHTEGGDFRQATYRALRQGLMKAECRLLEPYYRFRLEVPQANLGRAMTDLDGMKARMEAPQLEGETGIIEGTVPVSQLGDYVRQVNAYSGGLGSLSLTSAGYDTCIHSEEVLEESHYDPTEDRRNPVDSVFCSGGAGYIVPWFEVDDKKHVETPIDGVMPEGPDDAELERIAKARAAAYKRSLGSRAGEGTLAFENELQDIFEKTFGPVKRRLASDDIVTKDYDKIAEARRAYEEAHPNIDAKRRNKEAKKQDYFLVDGYNVIHAWPHLRELFNINMDGARGKLLDELANYQGYLGVTMIVVFDAYKVKGNTGSVQRYGNLYVVYTKEAETADAYIERTTHELGKDHRVTVATSDGLEQMIVAGAGARRMSSRELFEDMKRVHAEGMEFIQS